MPFLNIQVKEGKYMAIIPLLDQGFLLSRHLFSLF